MKPTRPPGDRNSTVLDAPEFDFTTPAYADFSDRLDAQLTLLVALWQHLAAPAALRVGRNCSRRPDQAAF
jgi:hypothetical protein